MTSSATAACIALSLALAAPCARAAGQPYLQIASPLSDPGYTVTYDGHLHGSNSHFNPRPGAVLRSRWADLNNTSGQEAAELGRLRVAEFGAARATADDGSLFGVGGHLREASFEDGLVLQGAALRAGVVLHVDYHFGGSAGGRIETNVDQGGNGRLDIDALLQMSIGGRGVQVREQTWATQDVLAGGQQRSLSAGSGVFDLTPTGFSIALGASPVGRHDLDLRWTLSVRAQCLFSLAPLHPSLPAPSGGCSYGADYGNTASFMGLSLFDAATGARLDPASYSLHSASGFDYAQGFAPAVPEPQSWALLALGLACVASRRRPSAQQRLVG